MDWCSRYGSTWQVAFSLDHAFCVTALERVWRLAQPEIFNSDQGVLFTSRDFTQRLVGLGVAISLARRGRGRGCDNSFGGTVVAHRQIGGGVSYSKLQLDVALLLKLAGRAWRHAEPAQHDKP